MKIGLGLITCNREDFCSKVIDTMIDLDMITSIVAVNDGAKYSTDVTDKLPGKWIFHETNMGVGAAKNDAMRQLFDDGCDYIFLIEDDILIRDSSVFDRYIELYRVSGVHHFNFGYHGPANKQNGNPNPRFVINYGDLTKMALNRHCVGAFSFYTRHALEQVGFMDPKLVNAWEHVEHTYRIIKAGLHPPYWTFADLEDSYKLLGEIACSEDNSTIRGRDDWQSNINRGFKHFVEKHGVSPVAVPDVGIDNAVSELKRIKDNKVV